MQTSHPEQAAHFRRVAELCRRTAKDRVTPADGVNKDLFEACRDFDNAVEFAAYEGTSLSAAIAEFLNDAAAWLDPAIAESLRRVAQPSFRPIPAVDLPVLPSAASKLLRTSAEDTSAAELESIASSDPALAARLLGAANSAIYGRHAEIRSLRQAVLRLGVPLSRKTLLAGCFGRLFASATLSAIWKHSKQVATLSHELASECGSDPDVAYLAGLLHDVGRLVTQRFPAELQANAHALVASGFPLVYAETLSFGTDHAELGSNLLRDWRLPEQIVEAVAFHHRPESTRSPLAGILCLAEEELCIGDIPSESLSAGMRRASAARIAGIAPALALAV